MKLLRRACLTILFILTLSTPIYTVSAHANGTSNANILMPQYVPLDVYAYTNKPTYSVNEVVATTIVISGGVRSLSDRPTYTVTYTDSTNYSYTFTTTDSVITINKAYSKVGTYSITIEVYSNCSPGIALSSITFKVT